MDQRERIKDTEELFRSFLDDNRASLWTSLPGIVVAYRANGTHAATVDVQPALQYRRQYPDGTFAWQNLPLLVDVPVVFPSGGGFSITLPLKPGNEGVISFSARCIDFWWQNGGVQPTQSLRMHNLSDGFFIPGVRSQVNLISNVSENSLQIRNDAGTTFIELTPTSVINLTAPGGVNINGVLIDSSGNLTSPGEGTFNGHTVGAHTHSDPQGGTVGLPTG